MDVERFIDHIRYERRYSPNTLKAYTKDLNQFFAYITGQYEIDNINQVDHHIIRSWIVSLINTDYTNRSINRKISSLKTYYRFLLKEKKVNHNPLNRVISPKTSKRLPQFLEQSSTEKLFSEFEFENNFIGIRDKTILEVFYATGIRLTELIELKETDINFESQTIKVLGKRNKERLVPFNNKLGNHIQSYLDMKHMEFEGSENNTHLFVTNTGKKAYPKMIYRVVNNYLSRVSTLDKKSPHILRHTFATHMLNTGADLNAIKEILGHANLSATQVYTHNTIGQLKSIHKNSHPREKIKEE